MEENTVNEVMTSIKVNSVEEKKMYFQNKDPLCLISLKNLYKCYCNFFRKPDINKSENEMK